MNDPFCNNCGNYGHIYYQCKRPITSIGIVAFRINNGVYEYLMVRRKDSLGFVELLSGKYNPFSYINICNLLNELTVNEKERVLEKPFCELWAELWGIKINKSTDMSISGDKFNKLKKGIHLKQSSYSLSTLIKETTTSWNNPEWGFPKGRRNVQEKDLQCAIREFCEETGYSSNKLKMLDNIYTFEEIFTGSNLKSYKHKYYVGYMDKQNTTNIDQFQTSEIGEMKWVTYEEGMNLIRPYNYEKKEEFTKINKLLTTYKISM